MTLITTTLLMFMLNTTTRGMIFSNGKEWARNRRLTTPAFFRPSFYEAYAPMIMEESWNLANVYLDLPKGTTVDLNNDIKVGVDV